jgi:hypothetical protein
VADYLRSSGERPTRGEGCESSPCPEPAMAHTAFSAVTWDRRLVPAARLVEPRRPAGVVTPPCTVASSSGTRPGGLAAAPAVAGAYAATKHHHKHHRNRIPQHNGGDHDADNRGGPQRWRRQRPEGFVGARLPQRTRTKVSRSRGNAHASPGRSTREPSGRPHARSSSVALVRRALRRRLGSWGATVAG